MNIQINGEPRQIRPGATLADLLAELGLAQKPVAVEINLQIAPRARHADRVLADGDALEIVSLTGGG